MGQKTVNLNHDVREIIEEFEEGAQYRGITVELIDVASQSIENQLKVIEPVLKEHTKVRFLVSASLAQGAWLFF